jgi:outer membrane protein assembly factor BamB
MTKLLAINGATGRKEWEKKIDGRGIAAPAVHDGVVYIHTGAGCTDNIIFAIDAHSGKENWKFAITGACKGVGSAPTVGKNGEIYVGNDDGNLYALRGKMPEQDPSVIAAEESGKAPVDTTPAVEEQDGFIVVGGMKLPINSEEGSRAMRLLKPVPVKVHR